MNGTTSISLGPYSRIAGTVRLPGSKSVSNRALLLAALADGSTRIQNLLESDDTRHMLTGLDALGIDVTPDANDPTSVTVSGAGGPLNRHAGNEARRLFLGNAGTAFRPLTAALCLGSGTWRLEGEPRMHERPIGALVDALTQLGARIRYLGEPGYPPLEIDAGHLRGGHVTIAGDLSSQFLTSVLMAAPLIGEDVVIEVEGELVSKPYIDVTLDVMAKFGADVRRTGYERFEIPGGQRYTSPGTLRVEGDASAASYFLAAGAIGGEITVEGIGSSSIQGDVRFVEVLEAMGASVEMGADSITVRHTAPLKGIDLDLNHIPDAAMTVATAALFAEGPTAIRNVYNWRVKETDRLDAMATELRKTGAGVELGEDYIVISPPEHVRSAAIDTYDDHRMAMCFALASLATATIINDPECTAKTYPGFFDDFRRVAS